VISGWVGVKEAPVEIRAMLMLGASTSATVLPTLLVSAPEGGDSHGPTETGAEAFGWSHGGRRSNVALKKGGSMKRQHAVDGTGRVSPSRSSQDPVPSLLCPLSWVQGIRVTMTRRTPQ